MESYATKSVDISSNSSSKSSASLAKTCARAEKELARSTLATMEAALVTLKQEEEIAAALAEAEVLESAAVELDPKADFVAMDITRIPHDSSKSS